LIHGEAGLTDDGSQRATVQFHMIWNNQLRKRIVPAKDQGASMLSAKQKTHVGQGPHTFSS
jgi:hypothetical protein